MRIYVAAHYHDNEAGIFDNLEAATARAERDNCECVDVYELDGGEFRPLHGLYQCRVCKAWKPYEEVVTPSDYWHGELCIPCYKQSPVPLGMYGNSQKLEAYQEKESFSP